MWSLGRELDRSTPPDALVIIADYGDPRVIYYSKRKGWHFLQDGLLKRNPHNTQEAITVLEKLRGEGASYLDFTQHTFWWFQYYQGFRGYLEARYRRVRETTEYVIFDVTTSKLEETTSPLRNLSKRATTLSPLQGIINSRPVRTQFIRGWVYASVVESLYLSSP
jgi:hypothetical protein